MVTRRKRSREHGVALQKGTRPVKRVQPPGPCNEKCEQRGARIEPASFLPACQPGATDGSEAGGGLRATDVLSAFAHRKSMHRARKLTPSCALKQRALSAAAHFWGKMSEAVFGDLSADDGWVSACQSPEDTFCNRDQKSQQRPATGCRHREKSCWHQPFVERANAERKGWVRVC